MIKIFKIFDNRRYKINYKFKELKNETYKKGNSGYLIVVYTNKGIISLNKCLHLGIGGSLLFTLV